MVVPCFRSGYALPPPQDHHGVSPRLTRNLTLIVAPHTCAMHTLHATHDVRKVSLWLGHATLQSTEIYLRADPTEKLEALTAMQPPTLTPGSFKAPDKVIAMLQDVRHRKDYAQ